MNSYERMARRLRGEMVDRPPNFNIMMTFAAQHIAQPLSRYYLDYRVLAEANLAVLHDFSLDIVQAISDPYREAADFGLEVEFPEDRSIVLINQGVGNFNSLIRNGDKVVIMPMISGG